MEEDKSDAICIIDNGARLEPGGSHPNEWELPPRYELCPTDSTAVRDERRAHIAKRPVDITCNVVVPDTQSQLSSACGVNGVLALQAGCYLCVDATTCQGLGLAVALNGHDDSLTLPKASSDDISIILNDQADKSPEKESFEQAAAVSNANVAVPSPRIKSASDDSAKPAQVSNWLFAIPVTLALVSFGLAIRNRVPTRRRGFKRLQDANLHDNSLMFQGDINPFCTSEEDLALETAGHFEGSQSCSDGEEAQFLTAAETTEDEFVRAEAEAIKQAVLLHIKEFEEEEDQVEV
ncbi:hypothetical protein BBO99_00007043 [Phytophthora kernoviae]|uniref:Uncharacterized protein n=2 Tax=Phytophthora kernoviae TaxID=325452 RepID=A0A421FFM1_9STRA|nr:hypothetical protein G195_003590 [Phytophthora kernoviae 00238/432]KAG2521314.1 hypothetical protein JM18_006647 [Phytophthora kernoviae]KAG2522282.1 hypothetical protein JM16_002248 [Phytophthora kernoviae]RLN44152.1 hypothetical protein BBI17_002609 [Phytophthora kernoviae]RLN77073.1 hypothetical protein BBO99_00007043 [Phytophthora kernoviae]